MNPSFLLTSTSNTTSSRIQLVIFHSHSFWITIFLKGQGDSGAVYLGYRRKFSDKPFAIKKTPKPARSYDRDTDLKPEYKLLGKVRHPNIVKCYESFEDESYNYLVMDYLNGEDLLSYIAKKGELSEMEVGQIMKQAFLAVSQLHSKGILHRDIKPANFMVVQSEEGIRVVLVDFGFSKCFEKHQILSDKCGTPLFMAPEVITGKYNHSCDYWSLGVMMNYLLVGRYPFFAKGREELYAKIKNPKIPLTFVGSKWREISPEAKDLLKNLLDRDSSARMTAAEALKHPWIKKVEATNLSPTISVKNPTKATDSSMMTTQESSPSSAQLKCSVTGF